MQAKQHFSSSSSSSSSSSYLNSAFLPLPFIEESTLQKLGLLPVSPNAPNAAASGNASTGSGITDSASSSTPLLVEFTTQAEEANKQATSLLRTTNTQLREVGIPVGEEGKGESKGNLQVILSALAAQLDIASLQRIAAGKVHNPMQDSLTRTQLHKEYVVMQKSVVERKLSILQDAIQRNPDNPTMLHALHQLVIRLHQTSKQPDNIEKAFKTALMELPLDVKLYYQKWLSNFTSFSLSDYPSLMSQLSDIYTQLAHAVKNAQAADEFNNMLNSSGTNNVNTSKLQQQHREAELQHNLECIKCDNLLLRIALEKKCGHTERAVAIVQVKCALF